MTQEELDKIVEQHQHWIKEDCEGWEDMKANLSDANLRDADLRDADKFRLDKVITLLKDKANYNECAYKFKSEELADTCRFYEDELRHHKYKRCLAMARWCASERDIYHITPRFAKMNFYTKWRKHWLELAEKFKEAK